MITGLTHSATKDVVMNDDGRDQSKPSDAMFCFIAFRTISISIGLTCYRSSRVKSLAAQLDVTSTLVRS